MKLSERVKTKMQKWLEVRPASEIGGIVIREPYSFETDAIRNRIWYRGDADELKQLYAQIPGTDAGCSRFWAAVPTGDTVRKMHTGLPGIIVDVLAGVVVGDYGGMEFLDDNGDDDKALNDRWKEVQEAISFAGILEQALVDMLVTGGGAFRVSWDRRISAYPSLEFYGEDRSKCHTRSGFVTGVSFFTDYWQGNDRYQLEELREPGWIRYILRDAGGKPVDLKTVPELAGLKDTPVPAGIVTAIPFQVWKSSKWDGRGRSIYASKTDDFDALDEIASQWLDAVRQGRVQKYIPQDMIPHNPKTGELMQVDAFGTNFVQVENPVGETGSNSKRIEIVQPDIRYEAYKESYISAIDLCLQGILSPATLGINIAATASGEAKREGKDVTGFTRNRITAKLEDVLPKVAAALLMVQDWINGEPIKKYTPSVSFGEYAAPDFGTRVKAIREADAAGAMSTEAKVDEIWGSSKTREWKAEEVARIKQEKGIIEVEEPSVGDELP